MNSIDIHCATSIGILERQCRTFFESKFPNSQLHFADIAPDALCHETAQAITDVIFFGGLVKRFSELTHWNIKNVRLWVLSSSFKQIAVTVFKIPAEKIGVIPREELFPLQHPHREWPHSSKTTKLVYSGRLSPVKNIEALIRVVHYLQSEKNLDLTLDLYGDFDEEINLSWKPEYRHPYRELIDQTVDGLKWKRKPAFHGNLPEDEWIKHAPADGILINLSKYFQEDFGVSIAQWEQDGRCLLLSDWGGHRDSTCPSLRLVPAHAIPESYQPSHVMDALIPQLGKIIFDQLQSPSNNRPGNPKYSLPLPTSIEELLPLSQKFRQRFGEDVDYIDRNMWDTLNTKKAGQNLFLELEQCLAERYRGNYTAVISNWFPSSFHAETKNVPHICEQELAIDESVEFLYFKEIALPLNQKKLLNASRILIPYYRDEMLPLLKRIVLLLGEEATVDLFITKDQEPLLPMLSNTLREQDRVQVFGDRDFCQSVEIEINSQCNQSCSYCPNSTQQRIEQGEISPVLFEKILRDLSMINFSGRISYHFYGEPLLNPNLEEYVAKTREICPLATPVLYSNGALLTRTKFNQLLNAGVKQFNITMHESIDSIPLQEFISELDQETQNIISLESHEKLYLSNRGGSVSHIEGDPLASFFSCIIPQKIMVITLKGNVLPCYDDYHQQNIMGNVQERPLIDIWNSEKYIKFRRDLANRKRSLYSPCNECNTFKPERSIL